MSENGHERLLRILLRIGGVLTLLALPTVFLPDASMVSTHAWLGLGEFPDVPISGYLARSLSAFYAIHGGLLLVLSVDVRRYRPVILFVGISTAVLGGLLLGIDLHVGMPSWWTAFEGPPVIGIGLLLTWLARKVPA